MGALSQTLKSPAARRYVEFGTGVGIAIGARDLSVVLVRVRFGRVTVLRRAVIENFRERPAAEWGAEYDQLLASGGVSHLAAWVVLPRREVIVRRVELPGVADADLGNALAFEAESLHPYEDDGAVWGWCRLHGSASVLVGLANRDIVDRYRELFAEAGIKSASFTVPAAALHGALRFRREPLPEAFLAAGGFDGSFELYGESSHYPVYTVPLTGDAERSFAAARSELRLESDAEPAAFADLLPAPVKAPEELSADHDALAYAGALSGACPWLASDVNLLPESARVNTSRVRYIPTVALAVILIGLLTVWGFQERIARQRYLAAIDAEIARLEPQLRETMAIEEKIEQARRRVLLMDGFAKRVSADMSALSGLSTLLEPPAWLSQLELERDTVSIYGEATQAAGLLRTLDESPLFRNSEFALPISRKGSNELFRIRSVREENAR